jgi:hypothetical protein
VQYALGVAEVGPDKVFVDLNEFGFVVTEAVVNLGADGLVTAGPMLFQKFTHGLPAAASCSSRCAIWCVCSTRRRFRTVRGEVGEVASLPPARTFSSLSTRWRAEIGELSRARGVTRADALHFLLNTSHGNSLVHRLHGRGRQKREETVPMSLSEIAKRYGAVAVAKHVVDRGASSISEHDFVKVVAENVERRAGESREQAFVRVFSADDAGGLLMRKAVAIIKNMPRMRRDDGGGTKAIDELTTKAAELRRRDPSLSKEQSFTKVYEDPENADLARRERLESRPHG